jgi:thiol-disulfide isomerase/thioredoxin
LPIEGEIPSLKHAVGWLNSPPLDKADLHGKAVLINFWTYTCINSLRTLPYLRAWAQKYQNQGLMVIGVHTPEFTFEYDVDNIRLAAKKDRVDYPIAIDSDYAVWQAFENEYWPAIYLTDQDGRIRHHQFGEGAYERTESAIQELLRNGDRGNVSHELVSISGRGIEAAPDWASLQSPKAMWALLSLRTLSPNARGVRMLSLHNWSSTIGHWRETGASAERQPS